MSTTFDCEIQVRLRDINLGGHVDSVEAIRVIDEARLLFLRFADLEHPEAAPHRAGGGLLAPAPPGVTELVGSQRVDYHAEMRFAAFQPFLARLWVPRVGRSSFIVATELRVAADHPPALVAETTVVCWDQAAEVSWPIDDEIRGHLERYAGPPAALRERPAG